MNNVKKYYSLIQIYTKLKKKELLELLDAYDDYIQDANDDDRYKGGDFYPVCIEEVQL